MRGSCDAGLHRSRTGRRGQPRRYPGPSPTGGGCRSWVRGLRCPARGTRARPLFRASPARTSRALAVARSAACRSLVSRDQPRSRAPLSQASTRARPALRGCSRRCHTRAARAACWRWRWPATPGSCGGLCPPMSSSSPARAPGVAHVASKRGARMESGRVAGQRSPRAP